MRTVFRGCRALLGANSNLTPSAIDLVIEDGYIRDICAPNSVINADVIIEAHGTLATPGLINGHMHSHEHFQKGRFDNLPLELWMNFVRSPKLAELSAREVYLRTMIGAIESVRTGVTTVVDDLNIGAIPNKTHLDAAIQAYEDIGLRAFVGISMMDKPFFESVPFVNEEFSDELRAGLRATATPDPAAYLALCDELAADRHPKNNRVGFIVAPSAPQRCSDEFLIQARGIADKYDLPLIIHVLETRLQAVTGQLLYGKPMIHHLDDIDFLRENTSIIHGIWLSDEELDILAERGCTIQHNPWSNLRLGSGLMPMRKLLDKGINISLGSDGCGSTDTCSMLHTLGISSAIHTLKGNEYANWPQAIHSWQAGTTGGAKALGQGDKLGVLDINRKADIVFYKLNSIALTPLNDPIRQLAGAERGHGISMTVVDGKLIFKDNSLTTIDEDHVISEIHDAHRNILHILEEAEASVGELLPAMQRIYTRCLEHEIPEDIVVAKFEP